jgi:hypothetical protein
MGESKCIDPHFLVLGTNRRWVVSFTPRSLLPRYPLNRRLGGPTAGLNDMGKWKLLTLPDLNSEPSVVQPAASRYIGCAILFKSNKKLTSLRFHSLSSCSPPCCCYSSSLAIWKTRAGKLPLCALCWHQRNYARNDNQNFLLSFRNELRRVGHSAQLMMRLSKAHASRKYS